MFNLGIGEVVLVLLVAFLIVGPKDLPKVARWMARQIKKARKLIREIKAETGWDELEKEIRDTTSDLKSAARDMDVTADLKDAVNEARQGVNDVTNTVRSTGNDLKNTLEEHKKAN